MKKLITMIVLFCLSSREMLAMTYPSQIALKRADFVTTLAIMVVSGMFMLDDDGGEGLHEIGLLICFMAHVIINGMNFKHEKRSSSVLRFLLPLIGVASLGYECFFREPQDGDDVGTEVIPGITLGIYFIKSIYDVYTFSSRMENVQ